MHTKSNQAALHYRAYTSQPHGGNTWMSRSSKELMGTPDQLYYWIPGEMVVIVRLPQRPANGTLDTLVGQVRDQLNSLLARYDLTLETYGTYGRWLDVPA